MLLFRRIFNFEKATVATMEHRLNERYSPGAAFPLQASLDVQGSNWPAKVQNLSGNGVGLLVSRGAPGWAGQPAKVQLTLAGHRLTLDARLVHTMLRDNGLYCGLGLVFTDFLVQKAYLQLLQPVAIGQSLKPVPADRVIQNEPRFIKQVFRGEAQICLTVWLEKSMGTPMHSFEFQMHDYFCRADVKAGVLEAYVLESADSHKGKLTNPVFDSSGGLQEEIRQLFRWILPNLAGVVPDDVKAVLQRFAA